MSTNETNPIAQLNAFINGAKAKGIAHLVDEGETHTGETVEIHGKRLKNFGSCGYMSLEFDPRILEGGIDAIRRYGTQFSTSRVFLSNPLYPQLEDMLEKIFRRPALLAPTTTLAHLAALPTLVSPDDVVLLDQQVHSSVQMTSKILVANGVKVEIVSHSNIARIERKIQAYKDTKKKIWYLGDGVYSMYGDCAPVGDLEELLNTYEQFHVYLDDAHGMSCYGANGKGYVLDKLPFHERLFLITGLAKGFGTGGGVITTPTQELKQLIRNCGGPQLFSGPMQPPILGAAVASAKIHLADDFGELQMELQDRIEYCNKTFENQPLPLLSSANSPIRFLGVGSTENAQAIVKHLMDNGFWLNVAQFPAVAPHHAGLRFMLNRKIKKADLDAFVEAIRKAVYLVIGKDEETLSQIWKSFSKDYRYSLIQG
ncbi:MAG: aminotransferase class I/II-fold pyridoxal phosphate-dependent enzyme [Fibrobacteria bacterium]